MALAALETYEFGGVDSRSNPLNMPLGRALRCRNWVPKDSGVLELRYGFATVSMSGSTSTASFHSLIPYTLYDNSGNETPYLILGQGTSMLVMNIATGAISSPTVKGAAFSTAARYASYLSNGKVHAGNGTDQKWFDGTTWRSNGLRQLTAAELANVVMVPSCGDLPPSVASAATLTPGAGGSFPATIAAGLFFYMSTFDTAVNELSASQLPLSGSRVTLTLNQKVTIGNLPDISAVPTLVKLISRTGDSTTASGFCTNTSTAVVSCTRSGTTLTVNSIGHGLSTGDIVILSLTTNFDSVYSITKIDNDNFSATLFRQVGQNVNGANTTGGTCRRIISVSGAGATVDVLAPAQDTTLVVNDASRGVGANLPALTDSGYQFYACIYNPNGGGHVGNRQLLGPRIQWTAQRYNIRFTGLPDLSAIDPEWVILIGRTGDGGQIPYESIDAADNLFFAASGQTAITLTTQGGILGSSELPTRNGILASGLNMFARVGSQIHGAQTGRPTVYRSANEADSLTGDFVGRPEQSWAPTDIDTFPTAEGLRGMFDTERGAYFGTKNDGAILADLGSGLAWIGPWYGAGIAGTRSWCDTPYGKFWLTGHKQLATFENGLPGPVSGEYETALLSKIGDASLSLVEMAHIKDVAKGIDKIVINAIDANGAPFEVIHDFRLRDSRSPTGQGYEYSYSAPLSSDFVLASVRDAAGAQRLWAGASTGQLYQIESGANDAGVEFSADGIYLINGGSKRQTVPEIRWYGDQNVTVLLARKLNSSIDGFEQWTPATGAAEVVAGAQDDFYYKAKAVPVEMRYAYLRFQLTSHSADGTLSMNDPPHVPLENYGRVYASQGLVGEERGI